MPARYMLNRNQIKATIHAHPVFQMSHMQRSKYLPWLKDRLHINKQNLNLLYNVRCLIRMTYYMLGMGTICGKLFMLSAQTRQMVR